MWISQASIDKRQMDLHGSGLFRTGEKRSEGERRPAIVFLYGDRCRKQRSVPHLRFIPGPLKKFSRVFFFTKTFQQTSAQKTHMHAHERTHTAAHGSKQMYPHVLICRIFFLHLVRSHLQVHTWTHLHVTPTHTHTQTLYMLTHFCVHAEIHTN